jgi:hypothetical protein
MKSNTKWQSSHQERGSYTAVLTGILLVSYLCKTGLSVALKLALLHPLSMALVEGLDTVQQPTTATIDAVLRILLTIGGLCITCK